MHHVSHTICSKAIANMGGKDLSPFLRPSQQYTHTLKKIREQHDDDKDPIIAVDVSNWLVPSLQSKAALEQYHSTPRVPATAVRNYVLDKVDQLVAARFVPIIVFDGQRNKRCGKNIQCVMAALEDNDDDSDDDSYVCSEVDDTDDSDAGTVRTESDVRDDISSSDKDDEEDPMREEDGKVFREAIPGSNIRDVSETTTIRVCSDIFAWHEATVQSEEVRSRAQMYDTEAIDAEVAEKAAPNTDEAFEKRQLLRLERYHKAVHDNKLPRSLLSLYTSETVTKRRERLQELQHVKLSLLGKFGKDFENEDYEE
jgi:hypothetical protein